MTETLVACRGCDLLQRLPSLARRERAHCARCGHVLGRRAVDSLERSLALTVAAALLLVIANTTPLMDLSAVGRTASATVIDGAMQMWRHDERITAVVVAFCALLAPAAFLASLLTVLLAARRSAALGVPAPRWIGEILRWSRHLHAWSLLEVMLLGLLVSLVKIAQYARVSADIGIFAVAALTFVFPAIMTHFDQREIWERIEWVAPGDAVAGEQRAAVDPPAGST